VNSSPILHAWAQISIARWNYVKADLESLVSELRAKFSDSNTWSENDLSAFIEFYNERQISVAATVQVWTLPSLFVYLGPNSD
jgi:hypothetical protein